MKRLLFVCVLVCLISATFIGSAKIIEVPDASGMMLAIVGGGGSPSAPSYLVDEDYDATETPTYHSVSAGSVDFDCTTGDCPLNGTQSLYIEAGANSVLVDFTGTQSEVWICLTYWTQDQNDDAVDLIYVSATDSDNVDMKLGADHNMIVETSGGSSSAISAIAADTKYFIKIRAKAETGGGGNAEVQGWVTTSTEDWGSSQSLSNGNIDNIDTITIRNDGASLVTMLWDDLVIGTSDISMATYQGLL